MLKRVFRSKDADEPNAHAIDVRLWRGWHVTVFASGALLLCAIGLVILIAVVAAIAAHSASWSTR